MNTKIYSVFPACGKSYIFDHQKELGLSVLDSDSSEYRWIFDSDGNKNINPSFVKDYVDHINDAIATEKYDYIFVSSHDVVRDALIKSGIDFTVVYPHASLKAEWVGRCYLRPYNGFKLETLASHWDEWINSCSKHPKDKQIILQSGQYLYDILHHDIRIQIDLNYINKYEKESLDTALYDVMRTGGCPVFIDWDRNIIDLNEVEIGTAIGWLIGVDDDYAVIRLAPWFNKNNISIINSKCMFSIVGQFYSKKENVPLYRVDKVRHAYIIADNKKENI